MILLLIAEKGEEFCFLILITCILESSLGKAEKNSFKQNVSRRRCIDGVSFRRKFEGSSELALVLLKVLVLSVKFESLRMERN